MLDLLPPRSRWPCSRGCASAGPPARAAIRDDALRASPTTRTPAPTARSPSPPVLIQHATVLTGTGQRLDDADVLLRDGRIVAVGTRAARHPPMRPASTAPASG